MSAGARKAEAVRAAFAWCVLALGLSFAGAASGVSVGDTAPDFLLPTLDGRATGSLSASHGKVRYVDFWASWCPPCLASIPETVALQEDLGGDRFTVIAINLDERIENAARFVDRFSVNYECLSDPQGGTAEAWDLPAMPSSFVVDPEGRVTLVHAGFRPGDMKAIRAHIVELLRRHGTGDP